MSAATAFPSAVVVVDVIIIIAIIVRGGLAGLSGCDIAKGLLLFHVISAESEQPIIHQGNMEWEHNG